MRLLEIQQSILNSKPFQLGANVSMSVARGYTRHLDASAQDVSNAVAALIQRDEAVRVGEGVFRRSGTGRRYLAQSWRTLSNEDLEIEPLLSIPAHMAGPVSVIEYAKTDGGMVA